MDKIYYELIWLFFWYGFLGWGLEVAVAAIKKRKFANKGLINGPFSVRYAIAATWIIFFFRELHGVWPVSYTHLDVYKRQTFICTP